jgi:Galactose oxidase, central domain/Kelch motif
MRHFISLIAVTLYQQRRHKSRRLAVPLLAFAAGLLLAHPCAATPGEWDFTNSLQTGRYMYPAVLLPNGMVLAVGGSYADDSLSSVELYDPASTLWSTTGSLATARNEHTATLLPNGTVLAAGGVGSGFIFLSSAELYNPATGTWSATGSLNGPRYVHTATLLPTGMVLVAGGSSGDSQIATCELYNPATGKWSTTGSLNTARFGHTATLLPNGKVLVAGRREWNLHCHRGALRPGHRPLDTNGQP